MNSKKRNSLKSSNTKKIIFLAFLLSLLFHVGSLVYISVYKDNQHIIRTSENQTQPNLQPNINKKKDNEWVETKARASNFGTPVFFQDEPNYAQDMSDQTESATELEQQSPQKEEPKETKEIQKPVEKPTEETPVQNEPTTFSSMPTKTTHVAPEIKLPAKKSLPQKAAAAPKPPLTLSQLSQGFLNHVKDEGKHAIHMLGKKSGTPSDEQIKYERYLQKLSWCLQNSFTIHDNRIPTRAIMKNDAHVRLMLNKDGSLKSCYVSQTSGDINLDHFITFIFKDASTSFPPVPEYLPHDPFAITYIIMVSNSEESRWRLYRQ
jgi:hypothetical protein